MLKANLQDILYRGSSPKNIEIPKPIMKLPQRSHIFRTAQNSPVNQSINKMPQKANITKFEAKYYADMQKNITRAASKGKKKRRLKTPIEFDVKSRDAFSDINRPLDGSM